MDKRKILQMLEDLDIYMINNLENDMFKNSNRMAVMMRLYQLQKIGQVINQNGEKGLLKQRYELLNNAFHIASRTEMRYVDLASGKDYFDYINDTRKIYKNQVKDPNEALLTMINAINVGHVPDKNIINYMKVQYKLNELTTKQQEVFCKIVPMINQIAIQENEIRNTVAKQKNVDSKKETYRQSLKVQNTQNDKTRMTRSNMQDCIVVSDLHGDLDRWNCVKQKLKDNPNLKVIILGDAMDRRKYGPEILLQIKELSDEGRIKYLPGNHDIFAYNFLKASNNTRAFSMAVAHLEYNGGADTMQKLSHFDEIVQNELRYGNIKNNITLQELTEWLGKQPIQRKVEVNGNKYALSHAVFDEKLYNYDENFNLSKALQIELDGQMNSELYRRFLNCMWYRQKDFGTHYAELSPPKDCTIIVGHTKQTSVKTEYLTDNYSIQIIDTGAGEFEGYDLKQNKPILMHEEKTR